MEEKTRLFQVEGKLMTSKLICEITSKETLRNFKVQISLPYNIYCSETGK
jgi:hypothetical protein